MGRKKFEYQENDSDLAKAHAENKGDYDRPFYEKGGLKVWTAKEGKNRIRIMPRTWGDEDGPRHWAIPVHIHYQVGPDNGRYPCPLKMGKGPCPMCEERARLEKSGDADEAKELRPSLSQLCYIIDRDDEESGPQLFQMPAKKLEGPICDLSVDEDTNEQLKIDHPENGHDVKFSRVGSKRNTDYTAPQVMHKPSYLSADEKEQDEWMDFIMENPLPTMVHHYDYDYLVNVFGGGAPGTSAPEDRSRGRTRDDDDDDDAPPPRSRTRSREEAPPERTRSRSPEPEEADDDDLPPTRSQRELRDETPEEGLPARSRSRSRSRG